MAFEEYSDQDLLKLAQDWGLTGTAVAEPPEPAQPTTFDQMSDEQLLGMAEQFGIVTPERQPTPQPVPEPEEPLPTGILDIMKGQTWGDLGVSSFFGNLQESFARGDKQAAVDQLWFEAKAGLRSEEDVDAAQRELESLEVSDPVEAQNIFTKDLPIGQKMIGELASFIAMRDPYQTKEPKALVQFSEEDRARLRSLGYLD